jgi:hypothetical protein
VAATGSGSLAYRWSAHVAPIAGVSASTYATPEVPIQDSGEVFTVPYRMQAALVMSAAAVLMVGPCSPKEGDLHLKGVDLAPSLAGYVDTDLYSYGEQSFTSVYGSPLEGGWAGACRLENVAGIARGY